MKRILIVLFITSIILPQTTVGQTSSRYSTEFSRDALLVGAGVTLFSTGMILSHNMKPVPESSLDRNHIFHPDRFALNYKYPKTRIASNFTLYACLALPVIAALTAETNEDRRTGLIMFAESNLITQGLTFISKALVKRPRPSSYYGVDVENGVLSKRASRSFFSGHTSFAFSAAVMAGLIFEDNPFHKNWNAAFWASALATASATGIFRITSGNHFLTDVLVGAVVGSLTSVLVAQAHR